MSIANISSTYFDSDDSGAISLPLFAAGVRVKYESDVERRPSRAWLRLCSLRSRRQHPSLERVRNSPSHRSCIIISSSCGDPIV